MTDQCAQSCVPESCQNDCGYVHMSYSTEEKCDSVKILHGRQLHGGFQNTTQQWKLESWHSHSSCWTILYKCTTIVLISHHNISSGCTVCSLARKGPLMKQNPPPAFGPISCKGSKFIQMSSHPGKASCGFWEVQPCAMRIPDEYLR